MPEICRFLGAIITMNFREHNPPHFHVQYGDMKAIFEIRTGKLLEGKLPPRLVRLIQEWRRIHRNELESAWQVAQDYKTPKKIKPLE